MSSSNEITYCLIFDTNALFQAYEKKADFTTFSFNSTFENVIDMINQLDIYNQVTVAIPSVVWNEMEKQIIEKHDELLSTYKRTRLYSPSSSRSFAFIFAKKASSAASSAS